MLFPPPDVARSSLDNLLAYYGELTDNASIGDAIVTPAVFAPSISAKISKIVGYEVEVWLKMETDQPGGSFKIRGAANRMNALRKEERRRGVVTASAGNHAQGVVRAAESMGIQATIVMPEPPTTPEIKIRKVQFRDDGERRPDVNIILHGKTFSEARQEALILGKERGLAFIDPYDDELVIAGQGTIAREIFGQCPKPPELIFVPAGGGGLVAGVAAYTAGRHPETGVVVVQPRGANSLCRALGANERVILPHVNTGAEGVAVSQIGEKPFEILRSPTGGRSFSSILRGAIYLEEDQICAAAVEIFNDTGRFPELAGAVAVAGLICHARNVSGDAKREPHKSDTTIRPRAIWAAIVSGGNIDPERRKEVEERAAAYVTANR